MPPDNPDINLDAPDLWQKPQERIIVSAPLPEIIDEPEKPGELVLAANIDPSGDPEIKSIDSVKMDELKLQLQNKLRSGKSNTTALEEMGIRGRDKTVIEKAVFQEFIRESIESHFLPPQIMLEFVRATDNRLMQEAILNNDVKTWNKIADRKMKDPAIQKEKETKKTFKVNKSVLEEILKNEVVDIEVNEDE